MALVAPREAESRVLLLAADASLRAELRRVLADPLPLTEMVDANDSPEAWQRIREKPPDLMVMVAARGELDAAAVCREVRSELAEELPIIALCEHDDAAARTALIAAGVDALLSLPLPEPELVAQSRAFLRLGRSI